MFRIKELQEKCEQLQEQWNSKDNTISKLTKVLEQYDHKYLQSLEEDLKDVLPAQEIAKIKAMNMQSANSEFTPSSGLVTSRINKTLCYL